MAEKDKIMPKQKMIPIELIEPDINPDNSSTVFNPLDFDFTCYFKGKKVIIPAGNALIFPTPMACHVAKHLAIKICMENSYEFLKKHFGHVKPEDPDYWRKVKTGVVRRSVVKVLIDALLVKSTNDKDSQEVLEILRKKVKKAKAITENKAIKKPKKGDEDYTDEDDEEAEEKDTKETKADKNHNDEVDYHLRDVPDEENNEGMIDEDELDDDSDIDDDEPGVGRPANWKSQSSAKNRKSKK